MLLLEKLPKKLLKQVRDIIRLKHYSYKTEKSYVNWIKHYIIFENRWQHKDISNTNESDS
ncbi:MAG: integrase [Cyanobacteria bacterium]|nr:integrase [Cyanobacteria bacterium GSL.Bin21]